LADEAHLGRVSLDFRPYYVEQAPLFRGLTRSQCAEVVAASYERRVARKQCFFGEGEPAEEICVLGAGRLKMTQVTAGGQQIILRLTGPGEVFGGLGAVKGAAHPATAEALEPSHALIWPRPGFEALAERMPVLQRNALRIVSERLRNLEQRYRELATERVGQRLARALLRLVGQMGRPSEGSVLVSLTRDELAQLIGTTQFTVSRLLCEWESLGLVTPRREGVLVDDSPGLVVLAEAEADPAESP
jgi:CRP-like cAMP-binding protein